MEEKITDERGTIAIALIWTRQDVLDQAENMETWSEKPYPLTEEEAGEILDTVLASHDADLGVSWETLREVIQSFVEKRGGAEYGSKV